MHSQEEAHFIKYSRFNLNRRYYYRIRSVLFVIILFIPFLKPYSVNFVEPIRRVYSLSVPAIVYISTLLYFFMTKKNLHSVIFIIYQLLYILSTRVNGLSLNSVMMSSLSLIAVSFIVEYMVQTNARLLLKALVYIFVFLVLINFIFFILFPEGVLLGERGERINFLHIDNELPPFIIPSMVFVMIYSLFTKNKITKPTAVFLIICILNLLLTWSGTGITALVIIALHLLIIYNKKIQKKISMQHYVGIFVVIFLMVVVFRYQDYFGFFIKNFLKKDLTFSNRVFIWDEALYVIKNSAPLNLLLGYGERFLLLERTGFSYYAHSHSEILEIILKVGFLGLALFMSLILLSAKRLSKYRENKIASLLTGFLFSFYIMAIVETCFSIPFYIMLLLSLNIEKIIIQSEAYQNKKQDKKVEVIAIE